ncbi:MAG TPA: hypothetical protein VEP93_05685, partial [Variovorax sp.]|nr:hypothetical protein [Variovorax sp.]
SGCTSEKNTGTQAWPGEARQGLVEHAGAAQPGIGDGQGVARVIAAMLSASRAAPPRTTFRERVVLNAKSCTGGSLGGRAHRSPPLWGGDKTRCAVVCLRADPTPQPSIVPSA